MAPTSVNQDCDEDCSGVVLIYARSGAKCGWRPGLSRESSAEAGRPSHFASQPVPVWYSDRNEKSTCMV